MVIWRTCHFVIEIEPQKQYCVDYIEKKPQICARLSSPSNTIYILQLRYSTFLFHSTRVFWPASLKKMEGSFNQRGKSVSFGNVINHLPSNNYLTKDQETRKTTTNLVLIQSTLDKSIQVPWTVVSCLQTPHQLRRKAFCLLRHFHDSGSISVCIAAWWSLQCIFCL